MNRLKLLTLTALMTGTIALAIPAQAETGSSWVGNLTETVNGWFGTTEETASPEVEAYLDEVTIAVPPMSGTEASQIEPAAGDYQPSLEDALDNVVPGSLSNELDEQSFNTGFDNDSGSVAAFDNPISAEDLANIQPAAGDAEEIVDESIVVTTETMTETMDSEVERITAESLRNTTDQAEETVEEFVETVTETQDTIVENVTETTETVVEDMAETVTEEAVNAVEPAAGDVQNMQDTLNGAMDAMQTMKTMQ